jgi:uncharacterized membrane protein
MLYLKVFLFTLPIFFAIDMIWLGFIAKDFYQKHLGYIMGTVNWPAAMIFYFLFIVGLVALVIVPAIESQSWNKLIVYALLFGLCTYATYDLTNLATIKDWPLIVTAVDLVWGMFLSLSVSSISYFIYLKFFA